jgi:hypothetical protein
MLFVLCSIHTHALLTFFERFDHMYIEMCHNSVTEIVDVKL